MKKTLVLLFSLLILVSTTLRAATPMQVHEVRQLVETYYVDPVSQSILNLPTIEEILGALNDPHTRYLSQEAYDRYIDSIERNFTGIGVNIMLALEGVMITNVIQDSPAQKAGLLPGDIILRVDGTSVMGLVLEEVVQRIIGERGTLVVLQIKRNENVFNVSVVRDHIQIPYIRSQLLDGGIGYIAIDSFAMEIGRLFELHIQDLKDLGARGWIIDLRNNGGGYLNGALDVLGPFIGTDKAMQIKNRNSHYYMAASFTETIIDDPVILLVNRFSASASEIVAAALKDHKSAFIMGENTFGKGTVQSLIPLEHGGFLSLTTWRFFSPFGNAINKIGVSPHVNLETEHLINVGKVLLGSKGKGYSLQADHFLFNVNLELARRQGYWISYKQFLTSLNKEEFWPHFYPDSRLVNHLKDISPEKIYEVKFNRSVDLRTVTSQSVQLRDSQTGKEVPILFGFDDNQRTLYVKPEANLVNGKEYWLTISQDVKSTNGLALNSPVITIVNITQ